VKAVKAVIPPILPTTCHFPFFTNEEASGAREGREFGSKDRISGSLLSLLSPFGTGGAQRCYQYARARARYGVI
jgi:hypothetical protein